MVLSFAVLYLTNNRAVEILFGANANLYYTGLSIFLYIIVFIENFRIVLKAGLLARNTKKFLPLGILTVNFALIIMVLKLIDITKPIFAFIPDFLLLNFALLPVPVACSIILAYRTADMTRNLERQTEILEEQVTERTRDLQTANEEIQRQMEVQAEQATEIELANTMLQERNLIIEQDRASLARERERSERLLLSVIPAPIAERMKAGETRIAEHFSAVTVLFADVVGFTKLSANVNPQELVELLDSLFSALDALAAKHGLEKIKTIGDAYMVVCGVPVPMDDHAERVARFAVEMQNVLDEVRLQWSLDGKELGAHPVQMRVGIHTGEAVAGVIGTSKFSYDLWGDTVNTASRMESHGEAGKIHVSEEVYHALKDTFTFEERGEIEVKGKGMMRTLFLTGSIL